MTSKTSDVSAPSQQRQIALSRWDNEGGAGPRLRQGGLDSGNLQSDVPELTNTELVQLRIRVIALENLVIALLAQAPKASSVLLARWQALSLQGPALLNIL